MAGCNNAFIDSTCLSGETMFAPQVSGNVTGIVTLTQDKLPGRWGKILASCVSAVKKSGTELSCLKRSYVKSSFSQSKKKISMESVPFENVSSIVLCAGGC